MQSKKRSLGTRMAILHIRQERPQIREVARPFEAREMWGAKAVRMLAQNIADRVVPQPDVALPVFGIVALVEIGGGHGAGGEVVSGVAAKPVIEEHRTMSGDVPIGRCARVQDFTGHGIERRQSECAQAGMQRGRDCAVEIGVTVEGQNETGLAQSRTTAQRDVSRDPAAGKQPRIGPGPRQPGIGSRLAEPVQDGRPCNRRKVLGRFRQGVLFRSSRGVRGDPDDTLYTCFCPALHARLWRGAALYAPLRLVCRRDAGPHGRVLHLTFIRWNPFCVHRCQREAYAASRSGQAGRPSKESGSDPKNMPQ